MRIIESGNAWFIENGQFSGSEKSRKVDIMETRGESSSPKESSQVVVPLVVVPSYNPNRQQINIQNPQNKHIVDEPVDNVQVTNEQEQVTEETQEIAVRRSKRQRRPAISNDYVIYSLEHECDLSIDEDPVSFKQAMESDNSKKLVQCYERRVKINE